MLHSDKDLNMQIGIRMQKARETCKITQKELARYADTNSGYISALERGCHNIPIKTLLAYCEILGTTPNEILCYKADLDEDLLKINNLSLQMTDIERKTYYEIGRQLASMKSREDCRTDEIR